MHIQLTRSVDIGIIIALVWQRAKQLQRFVSMDLKSINGTDYL